MLTDAWGWRMAHPHGYPRSGDRGAGARAGQNGEARKAELQAEAGRGDGRSAPLPAERPEQPAVG
jgi:hypothetical protein